MKPKIAVLYYSMFGNTYRLAQEVCQGVADGGGEAVLMTVPDLLPPELVASDKKIGAVKKQMNVDSVR